MKTFFKIAILASFIIGAIVSVFVFKGTRIVEGVDVSNVMIHESDYVDDIQGEVSDIDQTWLEDFHRVHNLISVYYKNHLLSSDNEEKVEISLVNKAALRLSSYALKDYFLRSSWKSDKVDSIRKDTEMLLRHKSANGSFVAQGTSKLKLDTIKQTCMNYRKARRLSLDYTNNSDAENTIDRAKELRRDTYLRHETNLRTKLDGVAQSIHDSHFEQIKQSVVGLQELSEYSSFSLVRDKVSQIRILVIAYVEAGFYSQKRTSDLNGMISDVNDEIDFWNGKINEEVLGDYYNSETGTWGKRQVRKYPSEEKISKI